MTCSFIISIINVIIGSFASSFLHWSWLIASLNILRQSIFIHSTLDWYLEPGPHWQCSQALTRSNYLEKGTIFPPPPSPLPLPPSKCVHMYVSKFALKTFVLLVNGPLLIWLIGVIGVKYTLLIYWTPLCWFHSDIRFNVSHASQKNMIQPSRPCVLYYRNTGFDQQSGACLRSQQMGPACSRAHSRRWRGIESSSGGSPIEIALNWITTNMALINHAP